MKVKNYVKNPMSLNRGIDNVERCEMPRLNKIIVRIAKAYEFKDYSNILVGIEPIPEYCANSISYSIRDEFKAKVNTIANFIDHNKGKRLLEILEMNLP